MARIYDWCYYDSTVVPFKDANLSIASSAVLYGLSVYTVFHVAASKQGLLAFRLPEHYKRLRESAKIIGIELPPEVTDYDRFVREITELLKRNEVNSDVFVRASINVNAVLPGTRSRGLQSVLSLFVYEAESIVPLEGVRLKTSLWRRVADISIPSRAKVNGAYVNSVLARQDALDSGYDDCIFLDSSGHVCELSAANIFMVRGGILHTPDTNSDLLEGINRASILTIARDLGLPTVERSIDLTELYVADEVFISGTSAFLTPVTEIDARPVGQPGPITQQLQTIHHAALHGLPVAASYKKWLTKV